MATTDTMLTSKTHYPLPLLLLAGFTAILYTVLTVMCIPLIASTWGAWFTEIDHRHSRWFEFLGPFIEASVATYTTSLLMFESWSHVLRVCFVNETHPETTSRWYRLARTIFREIIYIANAGLWIVVTSGFAGLPEVPESESNRDLDQATARIGPAMCLAVVGAVLVCLEEVWFWLKYDTKREYVSLSLDDDNGVSSYRDDE